MDLWCIFPLLLSSLFCAPQISCPVSSFDLDFVLFLFFSVWRLFFIFLAQVFLCMAGFYERDVICVE